MRTIRKATYFAVTAQPRPGSKPFDPAASADTAVLNGDVSDRVALVQRVFLDGLPQNCLRAVKEALVVRELLVRASEVPPFWDRVDQNRDLLATALRQVIPTRMRND